MTYIWGLDLIRFAAALMVVVFHFSWQQPAPQVFFDPGWVGVEIFFVISGFVIMGSAARLRPLNFSKGALPGYIRPRSAALW
jgi:exopolysaccharide production protein ExoZ